MRILLTGPPGSGKTTLVNSIKYLITVIDDYSRVLISDFKININKEHLLFQELWYTNMLFEYKKNKNSIFEYGFPDIISYFKFTEGEKFLIDKKYTQTALKHKYNYVIFIEPIKEDYYLKDEVRTLEYSDTIIIHKIMLHVLSDFNYHKTYFIPYMPLQERLIFFKKIIKQIIKNN